MIENTIDMEQMMERIEVLADSELEVLQIASNQAKGELLDEIKILYPDTPEIEDDSVAEPHK